MKATVKKARLDKDGTAKPLTSLMGYFSNPVYGGCLFPCSKNASRLVYVNEKGEEVEVIK